MFTRHITLYGVQSILLVLTNELSLSYVVAAAVAVCSCAFLIGTIASW